MKYIEQHTMNYILDEQGNPVPEPDVIKWAQWYQTAERHIGRQEIPFRESTITISTVFLGLDHGLFEGKPVLYETMVFGSEEVIAKLVDMAETETRSIISQFFGGSDIQKRYYTRDEAAKGHQQMCEFVEVCLAKLAMEEHHAQ